MTDDLVTILFGEMKLVIKLLSSQKKTIKRKWCLLKIEYDRYELVN